MVQQLQYWHFMTPASQQQSVQECMEFFFKSTMENLHQFDYSYSQNEKDWLTSVWMCERLSRYLVGLESSKLLTDHKPLVSLINQINLDKTPLRCQRLLMRRMRFNARAEHISGKDIVVADTLSRRPMKVDGNTEEVMGTEEDVQAYR